VTTQLQLTNISYHKFWAPAVRGFQILYVGPQDFWVLSVECASIHPFGTRSFEVVSRIWKRCALLL